MNQARKLVKRTNTTVMHDNTEYKWSRYFDIELKKLVRHLMKTEVSGGREIPNWLWYTMLTAVAYAVMDATF